MNQPEKRKRPLGNWPTQVSQQDKTFLLERMVPERLRIYHLRISYVPRQGERAGSCLLCGNPHNGTASLAFSDRGALTICDPCANDLSDRGVPSVAYQVKDSETDPVEDVELEELPKEGGKDAEI